MSHSTHTQARRLMRWADEHCSAFTEWTLPDFVDAITRHGNFYCAKRALLGLLELMEETQ